MSFELRVGYSPTVTQTVVANWLRVWGLSSEYAARRGSMIVRPPFHKCVFVFMLYTWQIRCRCFKSSIASTVFLQGHHSHRVKHVFHCLENRSQKFCNDDQFKAINVRFAQCACSHQTLQQILCPDLTWWSWSYPVKASADSLSDSDIRNSNARLPRVYRAVYG